MSPTWRLVLLFRMAQVFLIYFGVSPLTPGRYFRAQSRVTYRSSSPLNLNLSSILRLPSLGLTISRDFLLRADEVFE